MSHLRDDLIVRYKWRLISSATPSLVLGEQPMGRSRFYSSRGSPFQFLPGLQHRVLLHHAFRGCRLRPRE